MIRRIRTDDDPVLRAQARMVREVNQNTMQLLDDMVETMHQAKGIGLAATQIGLLHRVIVADIGEGALQLVNPVIYFKEGEALAEEGCLSLPGVRLSVTRALRIGVSGLNRSGERVEMTADNLLARVIQHEVDHLDGILITDYREVQEVTHD